MVVVVGPEGGLADAEVETLEPWARLDLGPHVLRAEHRLTRRFRWMPGNFLSSVPRWWQR